MPDSDATFTPLDVADLVLGSVFDLKASIVRLTPVDSETRVHRLVALREGAPIAEATLPSQVASAVVLRLAAIADIDLVRPEGRAGRCPIACGDDTVDLLIYCDSTPLGLAADVMVMDAQRQGGREPLPAVLEPGAHVGPFEIEETIGAGGMGLVYRAQHRMLRKSFALKIMRSEVLEKSPEFADWFLREARAAARIKSSWVVDVSDFGTLPDGRPYLAMELLSGQSLASIIRGEGAMPPARAIGFAKRIAAALEATHTAGVVHCDLSPNNVVIESDAVKLVDFGAASFVGDESAKSDAILGTPHYMAPERARDGSGDERTDLYSLGIMLFEMLTGSPPFVGPDVGTIIQGHVRGAIPPLRSPYGQLPQLAKMMVERMLAKNPGDRFASAGQLRDALAELEQLVEATGEWE